MNPQLTIEFSCLEEMLCVVVKIRDAYREFGRDPEAITVRAFGDSCGSMAEQMDCLAKELNATILGRMVQIPSARC